MSGELSLVQGVTEPVLDGAVSVAVSPDGKHVYVASRDSNAVVWFRRDRKTGALTQAGCVRQEGSGGAGCSEGRDLNGAVAVAVSRDGKHVYVASSTSAAVAVFQRDRKTGALTQLASATGPSLGGVSSVAVSPDGKHVYVASFNDVAVSVFAREK